jgi:DDE superfamily endonuclease
VSAIEAISAAGVSLPLLIIFKGQNLQSSWFRRDFTAEWLFTATENAYILNNIGLQWLKTVFLLKTALNPPRSRVLLLDNQGSYITTDFL